MHRTGGRRARSAVAALALLSAACAPSGERRPNVLIVVVDALRADHLAAYGYARETSAAITDLAAGGVRFSDAYAQGASTVPTHSSLFTGRLPFQHGSYDVRYPLRDEELTMAEFFGTHGYRTFAVTSSVRFHPTSGYGQGFDTFERPIVEKSRAAAMVTRKALRLIGERDPRPFFGFLHYLGPHQPYAPPEPYRSRWHPGRPDLRPEDTGKFLGRHARPSQPVDADMLAYLIALYDGEIIALDPHLGRLLGGLVFAGLDRDTIVVLTADHGEQFKEHGGLSHGGGLWEELLRVPLIVRWPARIARGRVIRRPVQTVDLFPTLAALTGLAPPPGLAGRDLAPELLGTRPPDGGSEDPILVQQSPEMWALLATIDGRRFKYEHRTDGPPRLFDLGSDPSGSSDVYATAPVVAARLRELAGAIGVDRAADAPRPARAGDIPAEVREQLRALGYVDEVERAGE